MSKNSTTKNINEWALKRLRGEQDLQPVSELQSQRINSVVDELKTIFDATLLFVTVRSSFRKKTSYLRPIYTSPEEYHESFLNPSAKSPYAPFRFTDIATAFSRLKRIAPLQANDDNTSAWMSVGFSSLPEEPIDNPKGFHDRIINILLETRLWQNTHVKNPKKYPDKIDCFLTVRPKQDEKHEADYGFSPQHIFAIYGHFQVTEDKAKKAHLLISNLFDDLDQIATIDASIFASDGMRLIAQLHPEFTREDIAPADKVAFAIERLRSLLRDHMIGRHGENQRTHSGNDDKTPWPRTMYLSTTFERDNPNSRSLMPRIEPYPSVYRENNEETSFLLTHRRIPSITKLLLYKYFKSKNVIFGRDDIHHPLTLSHNFTKLFEHYDDDDWIEEAFSDTTKDCLHMAESMPSFESVSGTATPWEDLQISETRIEPKARSILAFVVEGNGVGQADSRCLPRGIFAIESAFIDGFSDNDESSLRTVLKALSGLIRSIFHSQSPFDYRHEVAESYHPVVANGNEMEKGIPRRLVFAVQKLDIARFQKLLNFCKININLLCSSSEEGKNVISLLEALLSSTKGIPDNSNASEMRRSLTQRYHASLEIMNGTDEFIPKETELQALLDILEAGQENFHWASYLSAMSQTLGDRTLRLDPSIPEFKSLTPGFSAERILLAKVQNEIHQVVKFTNLRKIKKEAENYRRHVRYKIIHAGRIPATGIAYDSSGDWGKEKGEFPANYANGVPYIPSYDNDEESRVRGTIISDLIFGKNDDHAQSAADWTLYQGLRDLVKSLVEKPQKPQKPQIITAKKNDIATRLHRVFSEQMNLWKGHSKESLVYRQNVPKVLYDTYRINNSNSNRDMGSFLWTIELLKEPEKDFNKAISSLGDFEDNQMRSASAHVVHGDMNCRNLMLCIQTKSYHLIDFESVCESYWGVDQTRLAFNLLAELYCGIAQDSMAIVNNSQPVLSKAVGYLFAIFHNFRSNGDQTYKFDFPVQNSPLCEIIRKLFCSIARSKKNDPEYPRLWCAMMLCAAYKEFHYSVESLIDNKISPRDVIKELYKDFELHRIELEKLMEDAMVDLNSFTECIGTLVHKILANTCTRIPGQPWDEKHHHVVRVASSWILVILCARSARGYWIP